MQYIKTVLVSGLLLSLNAHATILYSYQSAPYTNVSNTIDPSLFPSASLSDHATFSFTLAQPLAANLAPATASDNNTIPLSWSISDGSYSDNSTLNSGALKELTFQTDSSGKIVDFSVNYNFPAASNVSGYIEIYETYPSSPAFFQALHGSGVLVNATYDPFGNTKHVQASTGQIGLWTISSVPLPAAAWLFGSVVFGFLGWKRWGHIN
ncbi:hypothetical protein KEF85_05495 [Methylomonas paludis]|uniref:Secreted protein n=1 Tax=Methylomonas paludis TaxID=1173101 RepID=A0A975RA93_9GAMM|nr:hypothetical protein [Methylomonas paludis]QWF71912.1 hypothetical protein KEF85_05495 [Methylomonas paludis]